MSYTFVIKSSDKISGINNSALYNVLFSRLPREYKYYSVSVTFATDPAFFVDTYDTTGGVEVYYSSENGHITTNLLSQTSMETNNSPSTVLGFITRSFNTLNTTVVNYICYMSATKSTNQEVVVLRPEIDQIRIEVNLNTGDYLLVSTDVNSNLQDDLPPYMLVLQFTPVKDLPTK